jgi:hypothetical protein
MRLRAVAALLGLTLAAPRHTGPACRRGRRVRRRPQPAVPLALLLLLALGGCVTVESTLRSDGSAFIQMIYRTAPDATEFLENRRFSSQHVHVESVKIYEDQRTVLRATVDDVPQLSSAPGFALVQVERVRDDDHERLTIRLCNPKPTESERDRTPWLRLQSRRPFSALTAAAARA